MSLASVQIFVLLSNGQGNDEIKASLNCIKKNDSPYKKKNTTYIKYLK